jgi:GH25 family lysozyme M1 (1,4-beta-N-acetylmuramidase)
MHSVLPASRRPRWRAAFVVATALFLVAAAGYVAGPARAASAQVQGFTLAKFNGNPNMNHARAKDASFVYIEATEGNRPNPHFNAAHAGAVVAKLVHGSFAIARPKESSGAAQAQYFVAHGGGWSPDGMNLPPALEVEANPTGSSCYDLSHHAMAAWITDFVNYVHQATSRYPVIMTTANWWLKCTGNLTSIGAQSPLLVLRWGASAGHLPAGWSRYTFWDHADAGPFPGEQVVFNGSTSALMSLAQG